MLSQKECALLVQQLHPLVLRDNRQLNKASEKCCYFGIVEASEANV